MSQPFGVAHTPATRSGASPSASAQSGGSATGAAGFAGNAITIVPSAPGVHVSSPLSVWNRPEPPSTWADASVAWPHSSTSTVGVNHRRSWSPSGRGARNAVSDRLSSAATDCIQSSVVAAGSTQTPAGLPRNGVSVNESTTVIGWPIRRLYGRLRAPRWANSLNDRSDGAGPPQPMRVSEAGATHMRHATSSPTPSAQATAALIGETWLTTTMSRSPASAARSSHAARTRTPSAAIDSPPGGAQPASDRQVAHDAAGTSP